MKFHGITMTGKFIVQRVASLPVWTEDDEGRIIYNEEESRLYVGTNNSWVESGAGGYGTPVNDFTDNDTLEDGKMYLIDTSSGSLSANLKEDPFIGDTVTFIDISGSFDMYDFTVNGNGNDIHGDSSIEFDVKDVFIILVWTGVSWKMDVGGIVVQGGQASDKVKVFDENFTVLLLSTGQIYQELDFQKLCH